MSHHCPNCQRLVYNRRLKNCGYCGSQIPINIQFTAHGIAALDQKIEALQEQQRRRELERESAEKRRREHDYHHANLSPGFLM